jgi:hypothetical protein
MASVSGAAGMGSTTPLSVRILGDKISLPATETTPVVEDLQLRI